MNLQEELSAAFLVHGEVIADCGEDNYTMGSGSDSFYYIGAFDGCGGLGAQQYEKLRQHTGAWAASRLAALTTDQFVQSGRLQFQETDGAALQQLMFQKLQAAKAACTEAGGIQIGGSLRKSFPTTVSIVAMQPLAQHALQCEFLWAGDSRGYILDQQGLSQLTRDDLDADVDAFENLQQDARLVNLANADRAFTVHCRQLTVQQPALILTATDGGFAYFKTPMEFEYVLLETLHQAHSPQDWEQRLDTILKSQAGDDYTLLIAGFGFRSFQQMQQHFDNRLAALKKRYIFPSVDAAPDVLQALWLHYKKSYYRWD